MSIDAQPTINSLSAKLQPILNRNGSINPEIADAQKLLTTLTSAAAAYAAKVAAANASLSPSSSTYAIAFQLLDRHARWILSMFGSVPVALAIGDDAGLAARATAALASPAPAAAQTELARYQSSYTAALASRPVMNVDAAPEGVALIAAIASAQQCVAFLAWAQANPT